MDVLQLPPLLLRTDLIRRSLSSELIFRTYLPTSYAGPSAPPHLPISPTCNLRVPSRRAFETSIPISSQSHPILIPSPRAFETSQQAVRSRSQWHGADRMERAEFRLMLLYLKVAPPDKELPTLPQGSSATC